MGLALITGASSGIGLELANVFAEHKHDLVLVARRKDKLDALAAELSDKRGVKTYVVVADLSDSEGVTVVDEAVKALGVEVDFLVNNAGFGGYGNFHESDWGHESRMLQVNIHALTHLSKLFIPRMVARKKGRALNLGSTASFQPGPLQAVYFATKAYVLSLSEAVNYELKGTGVTVTALCPGPTASEFAKSAKVEKSPLFDRDLPSAREVAEYGYKAMMRGEAVAVHGLANKVLTGMAGLTPRNILLSVTKKLQEQ